MKGDRVKEIYDALYRYYGPQYWWPADTPFEVMVGTILTQNANWKNVEKAIANLKPYLNPYSLYEIDTGKLETLIRPSGYYRVKARRLKGLIAFLIRRFNGSIEKMKRINLNGLREELLSVPGVGKETCDSILLYALSKPVFVVDAYTKRIGVRHKLFGHKATYEEIKKRFQDGIDRDVKTYNEFHALLVRVGKEKCKKNEPLCNTCPLGNLLM